MYVHRRPSLLPSWAARFPLLQLILVRLGVRQNLPEIDQVNRLNQQRRPGSTDPMDLPPDLRFLPGDAAHAVHIAGDTVTIYQRFAESRARVTTRVRDHMREGGWVYRSQRPVPGGNLLVYEKGPRFCHVEIVVEDAATEVWTRCGRVPATVESQP